MHQDNGRLDPRHDHFIGSVPDIMNTSCSASSSIFAKEAGRMPARLLRKRGLPPTAATQSGVGLIEVLVAVLILSIGFLGIAALQTMSLSTNNSAMARSMATVSSYSILDAMRADSVNAKSSGLPYNGTVTASSCPTTTTTLAQAQLKQWCAQLGKTLGEAATTTGKIACVTSGECKVTITFDDSRSGKGGSSTQQIITKAIL
ncbi:type IV pilus modification protein PilV [Rhodanobacter sp. Root561]|uniref:type IV pilus modification protein PilV n=1 Tax=Rhodanobacter sp. Root561 TaxID=1736560 RepID=UPI001F3F0F3A|nr:type IV pilus modification protein PilV [Rhodanobacter sp. Root561]